MLRSGTRALSGTGAVSAGEVLVTFPGFDVDDPETAGVLRDAGLDIRFAPKHGARTPSELRELTSDAVGAIASTDPFDRSVLESASRLRVIARTGVGTDSIDLEAATENGIVVATTPGLNEETAADHTMALILGAVRRLVEHDASMRRGEWDRGGALTAWDLHGATVGIVGLGVIGRAVAKRLQGFDVTVIASDPVVTAGSVPDVTMVELDELLDSAEVITLHVPKLASTSALIGREELARMRPDAILVNAARGGVVDEDALVDALSAGRIRMAALDVFELEPPVASKLLELPNVILTPHIAGISVEAMRSMARLATKSVVGVLEGRPPQSIVNPEALEHTRRDSESDGHKQEAGC